MTDSMTTPRVLRPPDWRYQLAARAVANGQLLLPTQADRMTRQLAMHLRHESLCSNNQQRHQLAAKHADLATALELFRAPDRRAACRLEILLLARQWRDEIAEEMNLTPRSVRCYQTCVFCVESQLDDIDYILEQAIRPELERGPQDGRGQLRFVSKLLAYFCGLDGLEQLLPTGTSNRLKPWHSPLKIIQQMANSTDLSQLAELATARFPSFARDPQRFAAWLEQLLKRVQGCLTERLPVSPDQRRDWQFFEEVRNGCFPP